MITHIHGKLVEKNPTYVIIDCGGIGYKLNISLQTFSAIKDNEYCELFTHLSIKEDSHTLYGFSDKDERNLFRNLISVSGVGPSTAQVILSTYNAQEIIGYIATADVPAIQNVKGIGAKTAQKIIIDLKDKITKGIPNSEISFNLDNTLQQESLSALVALGFNKKLAEKKIHEILKQRPEVQSVEELVKKALSQM
ncbi:MAG: Holliday junction branch migration protein RuvA [Bacteroidota bacterium]|nr:Holliday junction branch migration protein RuvA [Bacteroidota bacterium]